MQNDISNCKGVTGDRWKAQIWCEGRQKHLGPFDDERAAAKAYDAAAHELKGDRARLNFPAEGERRISKRPTRSAVEMESRPLKRRRHKTADGRQRVELNVENQEQVTPPASVKVVEADSAHLLLLLLHGPPRGQRTLPPVDYTVRAPLPPRMPRRMAADGQAMPAV